MIIIWLYFVAIGLFFFLFFGSATGVCGCGWWADGGGGGSSCGWWANGGVGVCGSVRVGFGSVGGGMGFFFFGVDGRLWVAAGGGGGGVRCV